MGIIGTKKLKTEPLEKYAAYVVAIVQIPRVLARSGQEASKLAAERVRRLVKKEDAHVYIPGVTVIKGGLSEAVLEDIKKGAIPGLVAEEQGKQRRVVKEEEEKEKVDPRCRNCGHEFSLHAGLGCNGQSGITCGCIGFEMMVEEIDERVEQGEKGQGDKENKRRREREKKTKRGERKIEWGTVREEGEENEQRPNGDDGSGDDSAGVSELGSSEHSVVDEERDKDNTGNKPARCRENWDRFPTSNEHSWYTGRGMCIKCGEEVGEYNKRWEREVKRMLEEARERERERERERDGKKR